MNIENIKPYEKNAKKHPDKQLKQIAGSLKQFGWQQPIKVGAGGVILVGHGRYLAYKKFPEGIKEPWIIDENGKTVSGAPETRKLTDEEEKAYRLADNKLNESEWQMDLVIDELKLLSDGMLDLTGFSADLILEDEEKDDFVPEVTGKTKIKIGDMFQLGKHKLLCGDSTLSENYVKLLGEGYCGYVFLRSAL